MFFERQRRVARFSETRANQWRYERFSSAIDSRLARIDKAEQFIPELLWKQEKISLRVVSNAFLEPTTLPLFPSLHYLRFFVRDGFRLLVKRRLTWDASPSVRHCLEAFRRYRFAAIRAQ